LRLCRKSRTSHRNTPAAAKLLVKPRHRGRGSAIGSLILLGLSVAIVLPAEAAKRETIAQLEISLIAARAKHKPDAELVRKIGDTE
jgi:hypothetical protein